MLVSRAHGVVEDAGAGPAAVARPTDGGSQAGERHPRPARPAEEGPEGRTGPDRGDPARSARVRLDREGVRHADGGAQVRAREGGPAPQPVPDQPVEDGRRSLRAPARRADWPLQPTAASRQPKPGKTFAPRPAAFRGCAANARLRDHRPVRGRQGDADQAPRRAAARARARRLGDDAAAAAGRGGRPRVLVPHRGGVRRPDRRGRLPRARQLRRAAATGRSRSEIDRIGADGRICILELEIEGALQGAGARSRTA